MITEIMKVHDPYNVTPTTHTILPKTQKLHNSQYFEENVPELVDESDEENEYDDVPELIDSDDEDEEISPNFLHSDSDDNESELDNAHSHMDNPRHVQFNKNKEPFGERRPHIEPQEHKTRSGRKYETKAIDIQSDNKIRRMKIKSEKASYTEGMDIHKYIPFTFNIEFPDKSR
jgi:hypothetical protein